MHDARHHPHKGRPSPEDDHIAAVQTVIELALGRLAAGDVRGACAAAQAAAESGCMDAACQLGTMLWARAHLAEQELAAEGVKLLHIAAHAGVAHARYVLGLAFFRGQGVACNRRTARACHWSAAMWGHVDAQFELSLLLDLGLGGEVDRCGARLWEARAARAGHPRACLNRGVRLARVDRPDWAAVRRWYARAAAAGNAQAAERLQAMSAARPQTRTAAPPHRDRRYATLLPRHESHNDA